MKGQLLRLLLAGNPTLTDSSFIPRMEAEGYRIEAQRVETLTALTTALSRRPWDLLVAEHAVPGLDALAAIAAAKEMRPDLPVVVVSDPIGEEAVADIVKAGADDYLLRDHLWRLPHAMARALAVAAERRERLQAQQALRESEARFRSLACHVPGMVFELARDRGGDRFTFVSEGTRPLLGLAPEALLADVGRFVELIVPEERAGFLEALSQSARRLDACNWEGRLVTPYSNGPKWINVRAGPRRREDGTVLWAGIMTNITRNKRMELEAKRTSAELLELSSHVERVKEEERARIAREIHDDLGGTLTAVKLELASLMNRLPAQGMDLLGRVSSIRILVDRVIAATERIARDLRPPILDFGLTPALCWQAKEFENRLGIVCDVETEPEDVELPQELATALFRIFQEALTNVSKHAGASEVRAVLRYQGGRVSLEVMDNGRGIEAADLAKPGAFGIRGIFERCRALGGEAHVEAGPRGGTRLRVSIPDPQAGGSPPRDEPHRPSLTPAEARP
jgi:PAS domain S-box-containing protein